MPTRPLAVSSPTSNATPATPRETILLGLVGLSPAVLTETIWALAEGNPADLPDRVVVFTTSTGRQKIRETLLDGDRWEEFRRALARRLKRPVESMPVLGDADHAIQVFADRAGTRNLDDIRTPADHEALAEFLMERLRAFTENESTRLVVSLAGGRKTMGALLHSAMTLLGRDRDRITHVLVDEPWERLPGFLYPGCPGEFRDPTSGRKLDSRKAGLHLAEVPFVPLRYLFEKEIRRSAGGYRRLIEQVRQNALEQAPAHLHLRFHLATGELWAADRPVPLAAGPFLFLLYYAERVRQGLPEEDKFATDLDLRKFAAAYAKTSWSPRIIWSDPPPKDGKDDPVDRGELPRKWASAARRALTQAGIPEPQIEFLVPSRKHRAIRLPADRISILE